ncbi:uncharacterized protein [Primulina huaijiensis]|uniref:uncharacterized protein n=1 Tax=Primulina huaijiensis TaxID=1492673 RepID=UPI003CC70980
MMENSHVPEKSLSEGENAPKSCVISILSNDISGKVVINDGSTMNYMNDVKQVPDEGHYIGKYQHDEEEEDDEEDGDDFSEEELLAQMGYSKSEPEKLIKEEHQKQYYDDDDDNEEYENILEESLLEQMGYLKREPPKHEPDATPTAALKLVSALKGSREKEGKQTGECRVSWAPDVYDPPSAEHFSTTSNQRHKNEYKVKGLAGKNRQKMGGKGTVGLEDGGGGGGGSGSKGSKVGGSKGTVGGGGKAEVKYKDRKQVKKKHGGRASKYSSLDDC